MKSSAHLVLLCAAAMILSASAAPEKSSKPGNPSSPSPSTRSKWEILFDGKSTDKWRAFKRDSFPGKGWKVEDGALKTIPGGDVVDIVTRETFDNLELQLEWKISPGGNSGIMCRVSESFNQTWNTGVEYQVLDDAKHGDGKKQETTAASVYALIAAKDKKLKPAGEWNKTRIVANGTHIEHWLNGKKVAEYDTDSQQFKELVAASKFAKMPRFAKETSGHIALQHHHDEVWYRNIRVRRL